MYVWKGVWKGGQSDVRNRATDFLGPADPLATYPVLGKETRGIRALNFWELSYRDCPKPEHGLAERCGRLQAS